MNKLALNKRIIQFGLAFSTLMLCAFAWADDEALEPAIDPDSLQAFVDGVVTTALADHRIPGVVLAVVHQGETVLLQGYGYAREPERVPVDPRKTRFRTAPQVTDYHAHLR